MDNVNARDTLYYNKQNSNFFVDIYGGLQSSGIRKEDFVRSNFSPYLHVSAGKYINNFLSFTVGYQGPYFNFIGDSNKHNYYYLDTEFIVNINRLFQDGKNDKWSIHILTGTGLLKNYNMEKINWGLTAAFLQELAISQNYSIKLKVGGIMGWSIYQHDKDILPNISIGLSRKF